MMLAHRFALALASAAPIPEGFRSLHTCDNRRCVKNDEAGFYEVTGVMRPRFGNLWLVTDAYNVADSVAKCRVSSGESHGAIIREQHRRGRTNGALTHPERVVRGAQVAGAKLTDATALEILGRLTVGGVTQHALAVEYGVSDAAISLLVHGDTWKHLR